MSTPDEVAGRLLEALRPFAEAAEHLHPALPDDGVTLDGFTVAEVRNAYAVYHSLRAQEPCAPGGDGDAWRSDMENAPRDGTEILLRRGDRVGAASWVEWEKLAGEYHANGTYLGEYAYDGGASWTIGLDGNSWDEDSAPTHWRALPPPPAEGG